MVESACQAGQEARLVPESGGSEAVLCGLSGFRWAAPKNAVEPCKMPKLRRRGVKKTILLCGSHMVYDGGGVGTPDFLSPLKSEGEREKGRNSEGRNEKGVDLGGEIALKVSANIEDVILFDNGPHLSSKGASVCRVGSSGCFVCTTTL